MAARYRTWTPEIVRQRIRTSMLVRRLMDQATGKIEMTDNQLAAAKFLVERVVPRAEAKKDVNVSGTLTLAQLVGLASDTPGAEDEQPAVQ